MKTVALRFADNFAPPEGTIAAHKAMIAKKGYVWYGKLGSTISEASIQMVMDNQPAKVLLIHSGTQKRYWAYVDAITRVFPGEGEFPEYYKDKASCIKAWIKMSKIENAPKDILSKCRVLSSGELLSQTSRHSISPYYRIIVNEPEEVPVCQ